MLAQKFAMIQPLMHYEESMYWQHVGLKLLGQDANTACA